MLHVLVNKKKMCIPTPSILQLTRFLIKRGGWPKQFLKNGSKVWSYDEKIGNPCCLLSTQLVLLWQKQFNDEIPFTKSKIWRLPIRAVKWWYVQQTLQNIDTIAETNNTKSYFNTSVKVTRNSMFKWCFGTDLKRNNCEMLRTSRI